jgi:hypothetical protein
MVQSRLPGAAMPLQSRVQRDTSVQYTWHGEPVHTKSQRESAVQLHWLPAHCASQLAPWLQLTLHGGASHEKMQVAPVQLHVPAAHSPMQPEPGSQPTLQLASLHSSPHSQPASQLQAKPQSAMQQPPGAQLGQSVPQPPPTPTSTPPCPPVPPTPPPPVAPPWPPCPPAVLELVAARREVPKSSRQLEAAADIATVQMLSQSRRDRRIGDISPGAA